MYRFDETRQEDLPDLLNVVEDVATALMFGSTLDDGTQGLEEMQKAQAVGLVHLDDIDPAAKVYGF